MASAPNRSCVGGGVFPVCPHQAYQYGVYTRELLHFGDKVSMLLLLPPSEDFSSSYWPLVGTKEPGLTMPLQIFELGGWRTLMADKWSVFPLPSVSVFLNDTGSCVRWH